MMTPAHGERDAIECCDEETRGDEMRTTLMVVVLVLTLQAGSVSAQTVTIELDGVVVAPRAAFGIGINGGGSWYNFVGETYRARIKAKA